ncbi:MAG TPA: hypothetical protein VNE67_08880 [Acetobacteraceae bacterium]|nr:hypothetical protein [Acetobacteraceae bacterium]
MIRAHLLAPLLLLCLMLAAVAGLAAATVPGAQAAEISSPR